MAQAEEKKEEVKQQVVLVTGANKGIGLALCQMLVQQPNLLVIIGCRNFQHVPVPKEQNAKKQPDNYEAVGQNESKQTRIEILKNIRFKDVKNIDFIEIDVTNKDSVKKAAEQIKQKYQKIDTLVNNAGMAFKGNAFDINVVNTTLQTNYYGPINVTEAFLPLVKDGGKIIFTSSRAGLLSKVIKDQNIQQQLLKSDFSVDEMEKILIDFKQNVEKDKTLAKAPYKQSAYGMSKVAMSAYSRIIATRTAEKNMFVAAYCPGWCVTYMSSGGGNRTAENGAKGLELLCLSNKGKDDSGKFWGVEFDDDKNDNKTGKLVNYDW
eukprot:810324_1